MNEQSFKIFNTSDQLLFMATAQNMILVSLNQAYLPRQNMLL